MKYHNLQIRFSSEKVKPGMELSFANQRLTLGEPMPQTLANGMIPIDGYARQFVLLSNDGRVGAAWFYFYSSVEGRSWGVLDELELSEI